MHSMWWPWLKGSSSSDTSDCGCLLVEGNLNHLILEVCVKVDVGVCAYLGSGRDKSTTWRGAERATRVDRAGPRSCQASDFFPLGVSQPGPHTASFLAFSLWATTIWPYISFKMFWKGSILGTAGKENSLCSLLSCILRPLPTALHN